MRIGIMTDTYKPYINGITNHIKLNKQYLEKKGHDVFIFTFGNTKFKDDEINVIRSPGVPLIYNYHINFKYSKKATQLLQTMDLIHIHHPLLSGQIALRYCNRLKAPLIYTMHSQFEQVAASYLPTYLAKSTNYMIRRYLNHFLDKMDMLIAPSKGMENYLNKATKDKLISIVPNGIELQKFQNPNRIEREKMGYRPDDILLVYVGRLSPEKNLVFLIDSFLQLAATHKQVYLLIIGCGPQRKQLEKIAKKSSYGNRIIFTGEVAYKDIPSYLSMSNIFVTASKTEVHPLSLIEAMSSGLPIVGINSVGTRNLISNKVTGIISSPARDIFRNNLEKICTDMQTRREIGRNAAIAAEQISIEKTIQLMIQNYTLAIEKHKSQISYFSENETSTSINHHNISKPNHYNMLEEAK